MEKAMFKEKVDSMLPELMESIRKECTRLYDCGGIDVDSFGDDFVLPKIILTVAIENQSDQYTPLHEQHKKEMRNLRHF